MRGGHRRTLEEQWRRRILAIVPSLRPYLAAYPPGIVPERYHHRQVLEEFQRTAILPSFSMPQPGDLSRPILEGGELVAVEVHENLHASLLRSARMGAGLGAIERVADPQAATVEVRWQLIPEDHIAYPARPSPAVAFDPTRSQRFELRDGRFEFRGTRGTGFTGFGTGRTFPAVYGDQPLIQIGAVVRVLEGFGQLAHCSGVVMLNGIVDPPSTMHLTVTPFLTDFHGGLELESKAVALPPLPNPDPTSTFLMFYTQKGAKDVLPASMLPDGMVHCKARTALRTMRAETEIRGGELYCSKKIGRVVGEATAVDWIGPMAWDRQIPFQSREGRFTFRDSSGAAAGSLEADIVEGHGFWTPVPGSYGPALLSAGIGPIRGGSGIFRGVSGFFSCTFLLSLDPGALTKFLLFRLDDPDGIYREAARKAWGEGAAHG